MQQPAVPASIVSFSSIYKITVCPVTDCSCQRHRDELDFVLLFYVIEFLADEMPDQSPSMRGKLSVNEMNM